MTLTLALQLCQVFGITSLLAFGGGNAVIPQFQMLTVEHYHWLTSRQFTDAFAIAQAAPGPSTLIVSLLGYRAGGVWGALIATAAMVVPTSIIVYVMARLWNAGHGEHRLRHAVQNGMAPIAVGLILAGGLVVAREAESSILQLAMTAVATIILCASKVNPLIVAVCCGVLGGLLSA
ncbi:MULTISPECIES: chromate transporter [unclassified Acidisoma]|jgi:chromate transporter|uniref:chromate transporter n=1 Tax=unclassified Acidisoma TaxID=2634065 RepID=UPI00131C9BF5|nr:MULTISPECIES: chromate transporter [unclassified Acidisoma]